MAGDDIRMVTIGGTQVGMVGLESIFAELASLKKEPSDELAIKMVEMAGGQNYIPDSAKDEYARVLLKEYRRYLGEDVPPDKPSGLSIKILGMGCPSCETLASNVRTALDKLGVPADVEHVRDPRRIAEAGVIGVPGLVIDGKIVSTGKALTVGQIIGLLSKLGHGRTT